MSWTTQKAAVQIVQNHRKVQTNLARNRNWQKLEAKSHQSANASKTKIAWQSPADGGTKKNAWQAKRAKLRRMHMQVNRNPTDS